MMTLVEDLAAMNLGCQTLTSGQKTSMTQADETDKRRPTP